MFSANRRIEFAMCDAAGILFFAKIFELAHSVYEEFILESNLQLNVFENKEYAIPLVSSSAEYKSPILLHQKLKVKLNVTEIGTSSFLLNYDFFDLSDKLKARVKTAHVFVSKSDFIKTNIPNEFLLLLEKHKN
jgi:acyl-CoA thioester hydrolase/1,4-dihydroxy-2-naphthoyl-CoA hydrolase